MVTRATTPAQQHRPELPAFAPQEFGARVERAREAMTRHRLDGIVLTSEANVEYLAGFVTQFAWVTPSRPWYFVVPRTAEPTAVIPEIGCSNWLETSWCKDIAAWPSPRPDDEGLSLLLPLLRGLPARFGRIGFEIGPESRMGMPVEDFLALREALSPSIAIGDATGLMAELRAVKSSAEIDRIRRACRIAGESFAALPSLIGIGDSETDIYRRFAADLLLRGVDKVPYASIGSGQAGYDSIIMGPTDRRMRDGDVLMIDTGAKYGGYFCDFDRNYSFGVPSDDVVRVHDILWRATEAGIAAARPGNTAADVFLAQARVLEAAGVAVGNVGRFGHGLGKIITEPPSNAPGDTTVLRPGMVLTIEPSAAFNGRIMVHEEDVAITDGDPELLTTRASREIARIA